MHGPKNVGSRTANGSKIVGLRFGDHETKDMLGIVVQLNGKVRGVYDVILYGCAVILFSSGRHVSKNCKIKMTRKSLLSDFSRMKKH